MTENEDFDPQEYVSEQCDHHRHRRCKEVYTIIVKKEVICTCDCHVTSTAVVDF